MEDEPTHSVAPDAVAPLGQPRQHDDTRRQNDDDVMTPRQATLLAAACVAASLALAPVSAQDASSAPADYNIGKDACIFEGTPDLLLDVARSNEDFSTLMAAIDSVPELAPAFGSKAEKLTILAPTNDAFETFFADFNSTAEDFLKDDRLVKLILSYHVVPSVVPHSDMEMALKPLFMSQVSRASPADASAHPTTTTSAPRPTPSLTPLSLSLSANPPTHSPGGRDDQRPRGRPRPHQGQARG